MPITCPECGGDMTVPKLPFKIASSKPYCLACDSKREAEELQAQLKTKSQEAQQREKQLLIEQYLADSCIGKRFLGMTFKDYKPVCNHAGEVLAECREFAESFKADSGRNLIMAGATGTGKNMLSSVIGQEVIRSSFSFLHTTAIKIVRRYKDSWISKAETERDVLKYFLAPDLLAIDEIGVQFGSDTEQLYLTELINDRYEAMKSTILISNLTVKQIEDTLGHRSVERFHENGSRVLIFNWQSYRKQQGSAQLRAVR